MRAYWIIAALVTAAACNREKAPQPETPAAETPTAEDGPIEAVPNTPLPSNKYPADWNVAWGWPGEYPAGFGIGKDAIVLKGRSDIDVTAAATITCPLPKLANYHPWNQQRNAADNVDYISATKTFLFTFPADQVVPASSVAGAQDLQVKKGDAFRYLHYIAEGYFVAEKDGVEYEMHIGDMPENIPEFSGDTRMQEDLWVQLDCAPGADGKRARAWLLLSDFESADGIVMNHFSGFGEASDLTEEEALQLSPAGSGD